MTGAGQPVDICNQWVIIEDVCHRIIRDQDKSWIDGKGQIKNVPFGDDISRWAGPAIPFAVDAVKRFEASLKGHESAQAA